MPSGAKPQNSETLKPDATIQPPLSPPEIHPSLTLRCDARLGISPTYLIPSGHVCPRYIEHARLCDSFSGTPSLRLLLYDSVSATQPLLRILTQGWKVKVTVKTLNKERKELGGHGPSLKKIRF
ncbi:hypothetical protein L3X38_026622 [Prunus dulcis]|uniref:Uncharacterized protein n=1 Tax=Prunus dulcis TaxID=3755 RepID=A0AAD4VNN7_PRUDU|nr:hypothetical protein L3X38_026622 [Prunus dulcis]